MMRIFLILIFGLLSFGLRAQEAVLTGKVVEASTQEPLEYATVSLEEQATGKVLYGGITDSKGNFKFSAKVGEYLLKVQFFSFKTYHVRNFYLNGKTNIGTIALQDEVAQLEGVEVTAQRTTVEMHLDKKIYNVGEDMTTKGGSVTDVLDNVPSVSVSSDGAISLRGSESVQILINGKPSSLSGMTSETLKQLPAEMIEKVEVVTNPSARYEAEGAAGIINIILKKGKGLGFTGSVTTTVPVYDARVYSGAVNLNYRNNNWTFFNNTAYRYSHHTTTGKMNSINFIPNTQTITNYQNETSENFNKRNGVNTTFGAEYRINDNISITNSVRYSNFLKKSGSEVDIMNYDAQMLLLNYRLRESTDRETNSRLQYSLNYDHKLNDKGQRFTADYQFAYDKEDADGAVADRLQNENTVKDLKELTHLVKADYILPFSEKSQLEAGYQGSFKNLNNGYEVFDNNAGQLTRNANYSNSIIYKENIHALYTQYGTRFGKFNTMFGLRLEDTHISIGLENATENKKNYTSLFPSVFTGYQASEQTQYSLSYTRRLYRPRARFINPFVTRSSNTNIFTGNPNLDPSYTNAFDLGVLRNWSNKFSFNASAYYHYTTDVFSFITIESGEFVQVNSLQVPIMIRRPVNLADQHRYGAEFTFTYTPVMAWRFSWNINFFNENTYGSYKYVNYLGNNTEINLEAINSSWFTRFSAKGKILWGVDFQANAFYMAPRSTAQSEIKGEFSLDGALSKEVFNRKATLTLNIRDLLNSRKMKGETITASVHSYNERQWRPREITLNFTYRFGGNFDKKQPNRKNNNNVFSDDEGGEFMY